MSRSSGIARWRSAVITSVMILLPVAAFAQGTITGGVKDASGGVLPGVSVEVTSPALIEKVRTTITDGAGRYSVVDLRPGTYTVTFTLPGFTAVKREDVAVTGTGAVTVNADLPLGELQETVTVTGAPPIIDVTNATRQRVFRPELTDALPGNRVPAFIVSLSPGINNTTQDVGGSEGNTARGTNLTSHGSRPTDIRTNVNGVSVNPLETGSSASGVPNAMMYEEILVDSSGASAEDNLGGVTINLIPKEGGNVVRGQFLTTFANERMQGHNITQELRDAGLGTANGVKNIYDVNIGLGGPIRENRLWFFVTGRQTEANRYVGGLFLNANAGNAKAFTYAPDTSQPAYTINEWSVFDTRITWQAAEKHKLNFSFDISANRTPATTSAVLSYEAASPGKQRFDTAWRTEYSTPLTNRLLVQLHYYNRRLPSSGQRNYGVPDLHLESIVEQQTGMRFRAVAPTQSLKINTNQAWRATVAYVTGTHNLKFGYADGNGLRANTNIALDSPIAFRTNNGVANQLTQTYSPHITCDYIKGCDEYIERARQDHDLGLFAQDRWTIDRLTLSYGVRFTWFQTHFPQQTLRPTELAPRLDLVIPETPGVNWKDLTPRSGVVYDVLGSGKTALKVSLNKYMTGQALQGSANGNTLIFGSNLNPYNRLVLSTTRAWTDANGNWVPDCNLALPGATGECGPMSNDLFGQTRAGNAYDPETVRGWGKRVYNWEFGTGVQHELFPSTGLEVTYYRRWFGNHITTDNRAVGPGDFSRYQITAPTDSRLPNGGGYVVDGLYEISAEKFGQVDNYITYADKFGGIDENWNGVDAIVNSRFGGVQLMGGYSTGRLTRNSCAVIAQLPELLARGESANYCDFKEAFLHQFKIAGSYHAPEG